MTIKGCDKIVSNFEADGVQEFIGAQFVQYSDFSDENLQNIFTHPNVGERRLTRYEIGIRGFDSEKYYRRVLSKELKLAKMRTPFIFSLQKKSDFCFFRKRDGLFYKKSFNEYNCWFKLLSQANYHRQAQKYLKKCNEIVANMLTGNPLFFSIFT